jgi:hypothetical protein
MTRKSCGALALVTMALTALASLSSASAQTLSRLDIIDYGRRNSAAAGALRTSSVV